jgi:Domain of unknown function (DUF4397)
MSRLFKVLPLALALVGLALFTSCATSSSQMRVVQTIPNSAVNLDIHFAGKALFTNVGFPSVSPSSGYQKVSSGTIPIEVLETGTSTDVIPSTNLNLGNGKQYTVLLLGAGSGLSDPAAALLTDDNKAPTSGNVEFRIVNASPSAPGGSLDVYIVPPGTDITPLTPQVSALTYQQASDYQSLAAATYSVIVTAQGSKTILVSNDYALSTGQIRSVVLVDVTGGGTLSGTPLLLSDRN